MLALLVELAVLTRNLHWGSSQVKNMVKNCTFFTNTAKLKVEDQHNVCHRPL